MPPIPRIIITPGEPAGIGPDITIKLAQQSWPVELIVVGDPVLLETRAQQLGLPLTLNQCSFSQSAEKQLAGSLKIVPVSLNGPCQPGVLNLENASYVLRCLEIATDYCLEKIAAALVTGPVHKGILNQAGFNFSGHTEFLAQRCGVKDVIMTFVTKEMKVALATTHIPLANVPTAITTDKLVKLIILLHQELQHLFAIANPVILVCGINPHAGEMGHLGREEIDIIEPALAQLKALNINVDGPLPADTIFTEKYLKKADVILGMYHDQVLPVVKYAGFAHAVNVTLGLPIIRTSVDHGTALDVAGTLQADERSLMAALELAIYLERA